MAGFVLSPAAERDIESTLAWTHEQSGEGATRRYEALMIQAIPDVGKIPGRSGSQSRAEIARDARTCHLYHSRDRVDRSTGRVRRPGHFLLYRLTGDKRGLKSAVSCTTAWILRVICPRNIEHHFLMNRWNRSDGGFLLPPSITRTSPSAGASGLGRICELKSRLSRTL